MTGRNLGMLMVAVTAVITLFEAGAPAMSQEPRSDVKASTWAPRDQVNAFYSGHSLSDGIPEIVAQIAEARGQSLDFEVQVLGYSLLRQRTKGEDASSANWRGYQAGQNRTGTGLDVSEELRQPKRLRPGEVYDVLVVTERHDLPAIARRERTAVYLVEIAKHLVAGNRNGEILFYHTWLGLNPDAPAAWVDYERTVSAMWACIASRANRELPDRGTMPRVRVLPGGDAVAELVAALWDGSVRGATGGTPAERVRLLFSDTVHLSDIGRYYMALIHYAVLFGHNPEGAWMPSNVSPELGKALQTLAWDLTVAYGRRANASGRMDMSTCQTLMQDKVCPAYAAYRNNSGMIGLAALRRYSDGYFCRRDFRDAGDPDNPFHSVVAR